MKLSKLLIIMPFLFACGTTGNTDANSVNELDIPSNISASVSATDCTNSPGPYITLDGLLSLGQVNVELVFRNNVKGTHEHIEESVITFSVLSGNDTIVLPKQPVLGGVGGNPWILLQLVDGNNYPLTDEVLLGRCVQGLSNTDMNFGAPGFADAWVTELECSNSPGPFINVDGLITMSGVKAKVIFRNNLQGTHEADVYQELTLMASGTTFNFPKQPPLGGVGGNPYIYIRYTDTDGNQLGNEVYLGRCKQLSKQL